MPDDALGVAKRDAKGSFLGIVGSQCGEHRTVGDYRAWCHACGTWCYPGDPCYGCAEPITSARIEALVAENLALKAMREAADDVHELLSRARGGSITDEANTRPLCRPHHDYITRNPTAAAAEGWALSRGVA